MQTGVFSAVLVLLAGGPDLPAGPTSVDEGDAYCRYVESVARSDAALLRAPELFGSLGHFSAVGSGLEPAAGVQTTRILAGIRYDLVEVVRGNLVMRRARAECARYRAMTRLEAALRTGSGITMLPALAAKVAVLRNVLPSLMQRMDTLAADVAAARATVEDLQSFRIRVDELRDAIANSEMEIARTAVHPTETTEPFADLLEAYWAADREVEEAEAALRSARAFGLELEGGYEELLTVRQGVPLFGVIGISYDIGHLWQGSANREAGAARDEWRRVRGGSPGNQRIAEALAALEATREAQRRRLEEVTVLARDVKEQLAVVEGLETRKVARFRDYLWVESARLEAERAFLERHVQELDRFLGTRAEPTPRKGSGKSVRGKHEESDLRPARVPEVHIRR